MKPTNEEHGIDQVEKKENNFYSIFLDKAVDYANGKNTIDGMKFRQLVAAAGVVAKQKQTRSAMRALAYQIERDTKKGFLLEDAQRRLLPDKT